MPSNQKPLCEREEDFERARLEMIEASERRCANLEAHVIELQMRLLTLQEKICRTQKPIVIITLDPASEAVLMQHKGNMNLVLPKPIKPGFRHKVKIISDEPLDIRANGLYVEITKLEGSADLPTILPNGTPKETTIWLLGTGDIGVKNVFQIKGDGHVGDGEAIIVATIEYTVDHPDATEITPVDSGEADEEIPAATP